MTPLQKTDRTQVLKDAPASLPNRSALGPRGAEAVRQIKFGISLDLGSDYHEAMDFVRENHPDVWAKLLADKTTPSEKLFETVFKLRDNFLRDQVQPDYSPPLPQQPTAAESMEQDCYLIHGGVPYMPLPEAARHAGVNRETLLSWIKNEVMFGGERIDALYFKPTGNHFISRPSVERMVNRFEKWPSTAPAGIISLEPTDQSSQYLSVSDAADTIGISSGTLRRWIRQGNAPLDTPLDVVRDTSSGYFYVQHRDVQRLAQYVNKFGLARGPRADAVSVPQAG